MSQKVSFQNFKSNNKTLKQYKLNFTTLRKLLWCMSQTFLLFIKAKLVALTDTHKRKLSSLPMWLLVHKQNSNMCSRATELFTLLQVGRLLFKATSEVCEKVGHPDAANSPLRTFVTSDYSVQLSVSLQSDVRDTCRKWEPPIGSWWRQRVDRLPGYVETPRPSRESWWASKNVLLFP